MAEGSMSQVMPEGNCLSYVLVEVKGSGYGPGYLRNLQRVGKPCHVVVTQGGNKDLCLMLEPAKSLAVDNPVPVTLKGSPYRTGFLRLEPTS
jgi:hypothetical protein